jgi:hypothetical protein
MRGGKPVSFGRAEEMSAAQIASQMMIGRALDPSERNLRRAMNKRVDMALRYQRTNGMVREVAGEGAAVVWEIDG